jgi:hypothetical protein
MRKIKATETNPRVEEVPGSGGVGILRQDYVEPEPVGTIVLLPFRIIGYKRDCDGEAMADLENLSYWAESPKLEPSGWWGRSPGLHQGSGFVVTEDELRHLFETAETGDE